jgi:PIN domain nuclease of toxin-antitoxin system
LREKLSLLNYFSSKKQADLLQEIYTKQTSYMFFAPKEIEQIITSAKFPADEFDRILLNEKLAKNFQYLICDQAVNNELMDRHNSAIEKLYPEVQ